jgi:hypothetical protein
VVLWMPGAPVIVILKIPKQYMKSDFTVKTWMCGDRLCYTQSKCRSIDQNCTARN